MSLTKVGVLIVVWPMLACGPTPPSSGGAPQTAPASAMRFTQGWDQWTDPDIGCAPKGKVLQVRGTLRPEPAPRPGDRRGKRFGGTRLVLPGGESLVVAYGATAQHRRLAGKTIVARGRYCDKQKQALVSRHFHIQTFTLVGRSR